jgi:hypothetical protein
MLMRTQPRGLAAALAVGVLGAAVVARADVTTERPASILVFPKVISNFDEDTLISISNTSNSLVHAHCFYVNAALKDPTQPQGPLNPPLWQEIDFSITLTRQQPTYWSAAIGRRVDPFDSSICESDSAALRPDPSVCGYAGFDPGFIPPAVPDFQGELKCIEVDDSGAPISGNHLKGEARLADLRRPQLLLDGSIFVGGNATYNAIGVLGNENNGDGTLVLGGGQCADNGVLCAGDDDCGNDGPCILEYNACPDTWILNHQPDGAPDLVLQDDEGLAPSAVVTELTVVPCTQNFETQLPTTVTIQFQAYNEFESQFSLSTSVTCWGNIRLSELGAPAMVFAGQLPPDPQGSMFMQTRLRNASGTPFGFMAVAEEIHIAQESVVDTGSEDIFVRFASRAAFNLVVEGDRTTPDVITVPADQLAP